MNPKYIHLGIISEKNSNYSDAVTAASTFDGNVYYYYSNPDPSTGGLIEKHEETYEEAKAILAKEASQ